MFQSKYCSYFVFFRGPWQVFIKGNYDFSEYSQSKGPVFLHTEEEKLICHSLYWCWPDCVTKIIWGGQLWYLCTYEKHVFLVSNCWFWGILDHICWWIVMYNRTELYPSHLKSFVSFVYFTDCSSKLNSKWFWLIRAANILTFSNNHSVVFKLWPGWMTTNLRQS